MIKALILHIEKEVVLVYRELNRLADLEKVCHANAVEVDKGLVVGDVEKEKTAQLRIILAEGDGRVFGVKTRRETLAPMGQRCKKDFEFGAWYPRQLSLV